MADKETKEADKPAAKADDKGATKADTNAAKEDTKEDKKAAKDDKKGKKDDKANPDGAKKGKGAKGAKGDKDGKDGKPAKANFFTAMKDKFKNIGKKKPKKEKPEKPKVPFVDKPDKPEKHSAFVHKAVQLDKKDNQFSENKFQKVRKVSNQKEMIEAFHRIGMCLDKVEIDDIPKENVNKVCFVLINNYPKEYRSLGVGPLNDAYLFALIHHKLHYKIVFMFNPELEKFTEMLEYFLANTVVSLTIYYAGRDSSSRIRHIGHGIQFSDDEILSSKEFGELVGGKSNGTAKILILADCGSGKSVFSMKAATNTDNNHCSPMVTFSVDKKLLNPKERRKTQGLLTYYFSKLMRQFPNATPKEMVEMLNISFERFRITFTSLVSFDTLDDKPMFPGADAAFNGPKAGNRPTPPNAQGGAAPAKTAPAAAAAPANN